VHPTAQQHIPEAVLPNRKTQPKAAAMTTLDSSLEKAVSTRTDNAETKPRTPAIFLPYQARLTCERIKCTKKLRNNILQRFDPTEAHSTNFKT
jgi:hypothetical protein